MQQVFNIRGTNGSGKSTLARRYIDAEAPPVELAHYQTTGGKDRAVPGFRCEQRQLLVVGDYSTMAGGMDKIGNFELAREAIRGGLALAPNVLCEGVLASTVYGSWASFAHELAAKEVRFNWVYLQTPLEVCLARIQQRNGGKPIKEDLVADKMKAIDRTREKAIAAGFPVYILPASELLVGPSMDMILEGMGDEFKAS